MGLFKHLLFWPVTGPSFLTRFSLEKVQEAVRTDLTDDLAVKRELMELQMALELGEVDEETYAAAEAELMRRLREVRAWRQQYGMPTSGGPVRVVGAGGSAEASAEAEQETVEEQEAPDVATARDAEVDLRLGFDDG